MLNVTEPTAPERLALPGECFKAVVSGSGLPMYGVLHDAQHNDPEHWAATYLAAHDAVAPKGVVAGTVRRDQAIFVPALLLESMGKEGSDAQA